MSKHGMVLLQTRDEWRLASDRGQSTVVCGIDESPETVADQVEAILESQGSPRRIAIGLESNSVLSDHVRCSSRDTRNRSALLFQFESTLPYSTEQLTADFRPTDDGVFGVAVVTNHLEPLVRQLEDRGIHVQSISAASVLALQSLLKEQTLDSNAIVVWSNESKAEILVCRSGSVCEWIQVPNESDVICRRVSVIARRAADLDSVYVINSDDDRLKESIADLFDGVVTPIESAALDDYTIITATRTLSRRDEPWFELRREKLAAADPLRSIRRPMQLALASAGLFLVVLTLTFWLRARSFDQQVEAFRQEETRLFTDVFPDSRVPAGILSRLESEHARVAGARGTNRDQNIPLPFPALTVLNKFLDSLPPDERIQFSSVRISNGQLDVDANLRNHGSAGVLVSALQEHGFSVVPPTSEKKDERTVTSLVHGSLLPDKEDQQ